VRLPPVIAEPVDNFPIISKGIAIVNETGAGGEASSSSVKRGMLRADACQDTAKAGKALFTIQEMPR
jgi:hypothetical protein